jgi:hypothetical protein
MFPFNAAQSTLGGSSQKGRTKPAFDGPPQAMKAAHV